MGVKRMVDRQVIDALAETGIIDDPTMVRRVVIDIQSGHIPIVHVEKYSDDGLINLVRKLDGIEVEKR